MSEAIFAVASLVIVFGDVFIDEIVMWRRMCEWQAAAQRAQRERKIVN